MKTTLRCMQILLVACCTIGCPKKQEQDPSQAYEAHQALHRAKYNQVLVEFPGHKYSMEIIYGGEPGNQVVAFLTDAHFETVNVDADEVKLDFAVNEKPKTFILARVSQDGGQPAKYVLDDKELAGLIKDGWEVEATAHVQIGGTPYSAKLVDLSKHDYPNHDHSEPGHTH